MGGPAVATTRRPVKVGASVQARTGHVRSVDAILTAAARAVALGACVTERQGLQYNFAAPPPESSRRYPSFWAMETP